MTRILYSKAAEGALGLENNLMWNPLSEVYFEDGRNQVLRKDPTVVEGPKFVGGNRQIEHHGIGGCEVRRPLEAFQCSAKWLQVVRKAYITGCTHYSMMIPEHEIMFGGRSVF